MSWRKRTTYRCICLYTTAVRDWGEWGAGAVRRTASLLGQFHSRSQWWCLLHCTDEPDSGPVISVMAGVHLILFAFRCRHVHRFRPLIRRSSLSLYGGTPLLRNCAPRLFSSDERPADTDSTGPSVASRPPPARRSLSGIVCNVHHDRHCGCCRVGSEHNHP